MSLLSIVVPTYNIENYIEKCIKSFLDVKPELYNLFEVIVINDGGTDKSVEIVEDITKDIEGFNIKIINKENGGHGSTINRGIKEAQGKYFKIIDGDDWVNTNQFEIYLNRLKKADSDVIVTNFTKQFVYNGTTKLVKIFDKEDNYTFYNVSEKVIPMHAITYKTTILKENNIKISEGIFYVDMQYITFPLRYVSSYVYWDLDIYQYLLGRPEQSMDIKSLLKNIKHHRIVTESLIDVYNSLSKDDIFNSYISEILTNLINVQLILIMLQDEKENDLKDFIYKIKLSKFNYKYSLGRKTSSLIYFNQTTKKVFNFILEPIIAVKLNKLKKGENLYG